MNAFIVTVLLLIICGGLWLAYKKDKISKTALEILAAIATIGAFLFVILNLIFPPQPTESTAAITPTIVIIPTETPLPPPNTPTVIPTPSPAIQEVTENLLVSENFEIDSANEFIAQSGHWKVINDGTGNKVLEAKNLDNSVWPVIEFGLSDLTDFTVEYRVKLVDYEPLQSGSGLASLIFRKTSKGSYAFLFDPPTPDVSINYIDQNKPWEPIQWKAYNFEKNIWYTVRVEAYGDQMKAYVDGIAVIVTSDSRLKNGKLAFGIGINTICQFDDIRVLGMP